MLEKNRVNGSILRQKRDDLAKKTMGLENFIATEGWFHQCKKTGK